MQITRRTLATAMLGTAAASAGAKFARADTPRTIALMFDAFDSEFWIVGNQILHAKAQQNGWTVLQTVSDRDQNKQNDQVKSMCERKVDAIHVAKIVGHSSVNTMLAHYYRASIDYLASLVS